jgi:hypothetical protein
MGLNSAQLKIIAMLTMLIDHVGAVLFPQLIVLRIIGRIAFFIFAFELVEGFFHTSNVGNYILRLILFGIVSEFCFDFAFNGSMTFFHQNVMFELALGLIMMWFLEYFKDYSSQLLRWLLSIIVVFVAMFISEITMLDYSSFGIMMILVFYLTRNLKYKGYFQFIMLFIINAYIMMAYNIPIAGINVPIQVFGLTSLIFIAMYNGEKGKINKYFVYAFYPVHLLILGLINYFI